MFISLYSAQTTKNTSTSPFLGVSNTKETTLDWSTEKSRNLFLNSSCD